MEAGVLNLDTGDIDSEVINTILGEAHSIKGGSGTFDLTTWLILLILWKPCLMKCAMDAER